MPRLFAALLAWALIVPLQPAIAAEVAADSDILGRQLGECMVLKSTGEDRVVVARWLLGVLASAPQAADVTRLREGGKDAADRAMAVVFTRLMVKDCTAAARALFAMPDGNRKGFEIAGEALGRVAMTELMGNRATQDAIGAYAKYLNRKDFAAVIPPAK